MHVDYLTVFVAGLAKYALGWAWYSSLFGKLWLSETKRLKRTSKVEPAVAMTVNALWSFVSSFVLYVILHYFGVTDPMNGITTAVFVWLGTVLGPQINDVVFEGQSQTLLFVHAGYTLASYIVMGAIIGYMG